ncbi:MAG TPA: glycosyltransferase family 4 protein [Thermoflexia bacterium]|nr:glycosyltransferase family 4 protein [Thermoflexia bacterium]
MRYLLDARTATAHFPGIGRYVANLAHAMVPLLDPSERLILLRDPTSASPWDLDALSGERVEVVDLPVSPFSLRQQWSVPRLLVRVEADLYHSPYYLMPYRPGLPTLLTVYDLIPLLFPQHVSLRARLLFQGTMSLALRTATGVVTISEVSRRDLMRIYRLPQSRVSVIPLAADPIFSPRPPAEVSALRHKYGLPDQYILYLGSNKPHKNLVRLIEAWALVTEHGIRNTEHGVCTTLVVAGAWDPRYPEPRQRAESLGLGNVRWLGPVPESDLPALYAGATAFVFPSLYEGFGLPVLEAMACGVPVLCSNVSSLPEVAGDAAVIFDPTDPEAIADALLRVLGDADLRADLRDRGLRRARMFSWEQSARATLALYRKVRAG